MTLASKHLTPPTLEELQERATHGLPGLLGIQIVATSDGHLEACLPIGQQLLAPNGYLHAGTITALADTSCGFGCFSSLPAQASGFTTLELKVNLLATAREGVLYCTAQRMHGGRSTQVWDATVTAGRGGKTLAAFRCTQLILTSR